MPLVIPQTTLTDDFQDFPLASNLIGGNLQITTNPAEVQLLYGGQGFVRDLQSQILSLGSYTIGRAPNGIPLAGIRARNASAGLGSVLAGYFWSESDPVLSFIGLASSQQVGAVVIPVVALADWPPASPVEGQTVWLELPAATYDPIGGDPVKWLCVYDESVNLWQVSGPPIMDQVATSEGTSSLAYTDLATVGPDLTIPVDGDYIIEYGALELDYAGNNTCFISPSFGGAAAADTNAVKHRSYAAGPDDGGDSGPRFYTALTALTTVVLKYKVAVASNVSFANRHLRITAKTIANA